MLINSKLIKKPRTEKVCEWCKKKLAKGEPRWRLYGSAERGDKPYVIWRHEPSCGEWVGGE